ncbi:MAG: putative Holin-X, holin superfamily [Friedmanniella sp.]|nr:putative Holin-X, holin superfamily [Friedmanniella sp.]
MSSAYGESPSPEETRSIGEILGDVSRNVTTLLRQEVELAKAEVKESTSKASKGVGMFVGAAVAGLLFLVFLSVSAWWGLGLHIGNEWSGLVVALIWAVIGAILAVVGKKELEKVKGLPQTADSVSKIPDALKGHEENNR